MGKVRSLKPAMRRTTNSYNIAQTHRIVLLYSSKYRILFRIFDLSLGLVVTQKNHEHHVCADVWLYAAYHYISRVFADVEKWNRVRE